MNPLNYFLNAALLLGGLLAAVPIIIHLLNKSKFKIEDWGAMMFIEASLKVRAQRLKLQQLLLLLLRALFFILLAMALARPILNPISANSGGSVDEPTTHILIIDGSYSMQRGTHESMSFDELKENANEIIDKMNEQDEMLIIWAGSKARPLFKSMSSDKDYLKEKIKDLTVGYEKANLVLACKRAFNTLEASYKARQRIYILTDSQEKSWLKREHLKWQELKKHYELMKVKPSMYVMYHHTKTRTPNLSVHGIDSVSPIIDTYNDKHTFNVEIFNPADEKTVNVNFYVNDKLAGERNASIKEGINSISFDYNFSRPGKYVLHAEIPNDSIDVDNEFNKIINVVDEIPVLIIEGQSDDEMFKSDAGLFNLALSSAANEDEKRLIRTELKKQIDMDELNSAYLSKYRAIFLVNVSSFSRLFQGRIKRFVENGGGLFMAMGEDVSIDLYNQLYDGNEGLMPAKLIAVTPELSEAVNPAFPANSSETVLSIYDLSRTRVLHDVYVRKYIQMKAADASRVIAVFNSDPFLVSKKFGKGSVLLWSTTVNPQWTNYPITRDFLPLIQEIARFLSSKIQPPSNLELGEVLLYSSNENILKQEKELHAEVTLPDKSKEKMKMIFEDGQWIGQYKDTFKPGIYIVNFENNETASYAVSLDPKESNIIAMTRSERKEMSTILNFNYVDNMTKLRQLISKENSAQEFWQQMIFISLLLLMIELVCSWKFSQ
ncbi:MAG: BatA domain-containing protein [Lentisphaeria bacterium]|nr:BatA domain-containing protein [Lentisphaeria bacterium]NQZ68253.1 BatA domain-containing protein [Lentisphaeria bacterium]